jgi:hypothetical protein
LCGLLLLLLILLPGQCLLLLLLSLVGPGLCCKLLMSPFGCQCLWVFSNDNMMLIKVIQILLNWLATVSTSIRKPLTCKHVIFQYQMMAIGWLWSPARHLNESTWKD